ncbi:hypothetical protein A4H97_10845 [Niastella yeongjuensis]|uniref:DUF3224 domain-containing protein n=1 Tax=Niastella yeongjuensis TaxID=354355 RepID=A0A1V9EFD5_9BACT|nr:DUF3224 domain-containing protein [Niastella yeongjuensis]OQP44849.1 hypothetical protein A4H97_10845 [Niastella yeongjuensis]SEP41973.1 Protein of unknown function [Niastella yeongjuensis]
MTLYAKGEFEVKLVPQTEDREIPLLGRLTIDKVFHGDITGSSQGQMLSARTSVPDSAGYVAIERVEGTINGKQGSFVLQHNATMSKGQFMLNIIVVPASGTDELTGIAGTLNIIIKDKKHFYEMEYTLPE